MLNNFIYHFVTPGQVANVPQGWWHYEVATIDNTHLLAIKGEVNIKAGGSLEM